MHGAYGQQIVWYVLSFGGGVNFKSSIY